MKEKNVPANLDECIKAGTISKRWWQMGSVVEVVGSIVMLIMMLGSLVGLILVGASMVKSGVLNASTGWLFVFGGLFGCAFVAFLEFCLYKFIALVLYTKSTIVYNSDVMTKIAIKNSADKTSED